MAESFLGRWEKVIKTMKIKSSAPDQAVALKPCPFCGVPLDIRGGVNPYGACNTEDCWMHERKMTVQLEVPAQVEQWNNRAPSPELEAELPCEVVVAPATHFCRGVKIKTVLAAIENRRRLTKE